MKKKLIVLIIAIILLLPATIYAYGGIDTDVTIGSTGAHRASASVTGKMVEIFRTAGAVFGLIGLIIIGMRYMLSSVEQKAQMKGLLIYYTIGLILALSALSVVKWISEAITSIG